MLSLVVALVVLIPELPPECQAPPTREVSALTGFAQSSGSLSVGLDSVATWCFDSGGTWTGGHGASKSKKPTGSDPTGDCAKAILSCEAARASVSTEARATLFEALKDLERPFLGVKYKPKRSGLAERPAEVAECSSKDRSTLFSHAQARMDLARLASQVQNEYANYKTWLFSEGLKCQQALARGEKDYLRRGIAVDTPVQGGGTQQVPTRPDPNATGTAGTGTGTAGTATAGTNTAGSNTAGTNTGSGTQVAAGGTSPGAGVSGNITTTGGGNAALPEKGLVSPNGVSPAGNGSTGGVASNPGKYTPTGSGTTGSTGGTSGAPSGTGATANVTTTGGGSATLPERGSVTPQGSGTGMGAPTGTGSGSASTGGANGSPSGTGSGVATSGGTSGAPSGTGASPSGTAGSGTPNSMGGTLVASVRNTPTGTGAPSAPSGIGVGGPTAEREKALGSSMLDKWRFFLAEQQKIEGDVDWVAGFLASRELRDCHCTNRPIPGDVVRRLENKDRVAQLEADDEKNTRCELCLLDSFPKWKVRAQKQCALALELSEYELGFLQRSDDGNGLPPRCIEAAKAKQAGSAKPTASLTTQQPNQNSAQPKSSGAAYIITKAPDPMPEMSDYLKPNEYAPIPAREEGRVYVRVFTSSACIAEVLPGPVQARTGDLLPVPPAAKEITVRGPCGGFAELYFGREEKPRVAESFARNQPLRLQFRP